MTVATDLINKSFGDYQAMATLFFDDFMGTQLKNLTHVRGAYPSFYELFPELSDTTQINALEAFVLRTLNLSSQGVDCAPGKAFAQRMDYIATNLGFENAFVVLLHSYHLASFKGYANNAQYIKEKLQNLYEENPDKALSIGSAPIAFNRFLVLPSCVEQLEKNSSNKMQQNSNKWINIILGVSVIAAAMTAYRLHENSKLIQQLDFCNNELAPLKSENPTLQSSISDLQKEIRDLKAVDITTTQPYLDLSTKFDTCNNELAPLKSENPTLQSSISDLQKEIRDLKAVDVTNTQPYLDFKNNHDSCSLGLKDVQEKLAKCQNGDKS